MSKAATVRSDERVAGGRRGGPPSRSRATAMPPAERRAAIVEATLPLLLEHGSGVTTKQIAEAAGIAEGTIFRVFDDKEDILDAVAENVFDPSPTRLALQQINLDLSLEERLIAAVEILQHSVAKAWRFMTAVGMSRLPDRYRASEQVDSPDVQTLTTILAPDAGRLARDPAWSALLLRGVTFACSHPALMPEQPPAAEIVSLFLDGIRKH